MFDALQWVEQIRSDLKPLETSRSRSWVTATLKHSKRAASNATS